jgi:hypothetical protein
MGIIPEATAAAAPPLDPPELNLRFQGFRVEPKRTGSVPVLCPNSEVLVLAQITSPAFLSLTVIVLS